MTTILDRSALTRLLESPDGEVGQDLARRCVTIDRAAKGYCPVDTGRLKSSINWRLAHDSQGLAGIVGTNVEYAAYVELGTRYMAARSFLRRALGSA